MTFKHPGVLHSATNIANLAQIASDSREARHSAYLVFSQHPYSSENYILRGPRLLVGRNPNVEKSVLHADANAAYQNAVMWVATGRQGHLRKAGQIIQKWQYGLKYIIGNDALLTAALDGFKLINAAELVRWTSTAWEQDEVQKFSDWLRTLWLPILERLSLQANGNWETAAIKALLGAAVFLDESELFERTIRYCIAGMGNGRLENYIVNSVGQCQESGRDQAHTQLGLGNLAEACEVAWNQGVDLYGQLDNRLLAGFEYTAKYNLGDDVPYSARLDRSGKYGRGGSVVRYTRISSSGRGAFRPIYEMVWNHFVARRMLDAPNLSKVVTGTRPETEAPNADHPGFGTFLFSDGLAKVTSPLFSGPILSVSSCSTGIRLEWTAVRGAEYYSVHRWDTSSAKCVQPVHTSTVYLDQGVSPGLEYTYVVQAHAGVARTSSTQASCYFGLPSSWTKRQIGLHSRDEKHATITYRGEAFEISALGLSINKADMGYLFVYTTQSGDFSFTARAFIETNSVKAQVGIVLRESLAPDSLQLSLVTTSSAPTQHFQFSSTLSCGKMISLGYVPMYIPDRDYRRTTCWFRIRRKRGLVCGEISIDGTAFVPVGELNAPVADRIVVGLAVCSGTNTPTVVSFDRVSVVSDCDQCCLSIGNS